MTYFKCIQRGGFQTTFNNGYTLSVMFSEQSYCSNNKENLFQGGSQELESHTGFIVCNDAEIALVNEEGEFVMLNFDTVKGYVTPNTVGLLMGVLSISPKVDDKVMTVIRNILESNNE